jgi:hypothetical protein
MPINFAIKLAATVAIEAVQIGLQASKRTYGPRLSETQITTADYGTPLPRFLGERRFAAQIVWSKDLDIVDHTSKVKGGGKQTTESALWTAGVAFADCRTVGPIDKVLKIWFDETLAYDATGAGPISYASSLGFDLASVMRVYTGSEDQSADPAYVEYCEGRYGPNSAPAFRGTAMLVFDRMPLDNFGNRPPQISVLAVSAAANVFPYSQAATAISGNIWNQWAISGNWMIHWDFGTIEFWDLPTRTLISTVSGIVFPFVGTLQNVTVDSAGTASIYGFGGDGGTLTTVSHTGAITQALVSGGDISHPRIRALTSSVYASGGAGGYIQNAVFISTTDSGRDFCEDDTGGEWGLFQPTGSSSAFSIAQLSGGSGSSGPLTATARSAVSEAHIAYCAPTRTFMATMNGSFYIVDRDTWVITASGSAPWGTADLPYNQPSATSFWAVDHEYSLEDGSLIRTVALGDWLADGNNTDNIYDPVNDALVSAGASIDWRYLDRHGNAGTTLGTIISKMCDAAGLIDRDTSALTQEVAGYSWTRGDVKSQMEPLLDLHDVDARPHDFTIEFKPRGSAPSGTITTGEFAKADNGGARYKITEKQDTDLPKIIRVNFADTGFDQQENNVLSPLPADAVDSQSEQVIDGTTYADTPAGMQQKVDRSMRRQWISKDGLENSLTAQQFALEPGDVKTLDLDGTQWNARLDKQTLIGTRIDCTWVRDETPVAILNSSTTGPSMDGRDPEVIVLPAPVQGFVIDAPYREDGDADVRPLLFSTAGAYAQLAFPGAGIWEATGAGDSRAYDQLFATIRSGATWGICSSVLPSVPSPWLWDRGNSVTVTLQNGSLTSVSEADIDADPTLNLIALWNPLTGAIEYVNFTTATLQLDGSYKLTGFKRGRRGTEGACAGHVVGQLWVLASSLDVEDMGTDDVGGSLSFKAQALGRSLDLATAIDVAPYTGASLKPYAPARIKWTTDGTDMFGEIIRRTRVGGSWVGGATIPLSENSEAYEVDIYHSTTFKRTISVSGTNLFTYTAAQISADGNTVGVAPSYNAYQISDAVGRGFALAA